MAALSPFPLLHVDRNRPSRSTIRVWVARQEILAAASDAFVSGRGQAKRAQARDLGSIFGSFLRLGNEKVVEPFFDRYLPDCLGSEELSLRKRVHRAAQVHNNKTLLRDIPTATAILDPFLHHAEIISIKGKSYRLKGKQLDAAAKQK